MYVCVSSDYACRLLGNIIVLFPHDWGCLVGRPICICVGKLVYYLAMQPKDDVAYKLSDLVKLVI